MANKHMKRYPKSLVIMETKVTVSHHYTFMKMCKVRKADQPKCCWGDHLWVRKQLTKRHAFFIWNHQILASPWVWVRLQVKAGGGQCQRRWGGGHSSRWLQNDLPPFYVVIIQINQLMNISWSSPGGSKIRKSGITNGKRETKLMFIDPVKQEMSQDLGGV